MEKKIKLISVCSHPEYARTLVDTASNNGFDVDLLVTTWMGFGTKLLTVREYMLNNPDVDAFFFADAFDVITLGTFEEAMSKLNSDKILFSVEKNCWPDSTLSSLYPPTNSIFKYLNSGLYYAPRDKYLALFDFEMPDYHSDDQLWATRQFLFNADSDIELDYDCKVFQSYSFIADGEYEYSNKRALNTLTNHSAVFYHGNGHTDMEEIKKLIA